MAASIDVDIDHLIAETNGKINVKKKQHFNSTQKPIFLDSLKVENISAETNNDDTNGNELNLTNGAPASNIEIDVKQKKKLDKFIGKNLL
jgi:hypothetical protein